MVQPQHSRIYPAPDGARSISHRVSSQQKGDTNSKLTVSRLRLPESTLHERDAREHFIRKRYSSCRSRETKCCNWDFKYKPSSRGTRKANTLDLGFKTMKKPRR